MNFLGIFPRRRRRRQVASFQNVSLLYTRFVFRLNILSKRLNGDDSARSCPRDPRFFLNFQPIKRRSNLTLVPVTVRTRLELPTRSTRSVSLRLLLFLFFGSRAMLVGHQPAAAVSHRFATNWPRFLFVTRIRQHINSVSSRHDNLKSQTIIYERIMIY